MQLCGGQPFPRDTRLLDKDRARSAFRTEADDRRGEGIRPRVAGTRPENGQLRNHRTGVAAGILTADVTSKPAPEPLWAPASTLGEMQHAVLRVPSKGSAGDTI